MTNTLQKESRFHRMTGSRHVWSPSGRDNRQNASPLQDDTQGVEAEAVGEHHESQHENSLSSDWPRLSGVNLSDVAEPEDSSESALERQSQEEESFPKKIDTNEWLHADGRVYKKLMFVIRKDQSEALDMVLAARSLDLGKDRSEVVRALLDHAGIKDGDESIDAASD